MKTPVITQTNRGDCGLACLAMVLGAHGKNLSLTQLKEKFGSSAMGVGLNQLVDGAKTLGLDSRALKLDIEEARQLATPAILLWGANHYVVLIRVRSRAWKIIDPLQGERSFHIREVNRRFSGIALELFPNEVFQRQSPPPRLSLRRLWQGQRGLLGTLMILLALSAGLQIMALLSPLYIQLVVDSGLARNDRELIPLLAMGFGALAVLQVSTAFTRSMITLRAGNQLTQHLSSNFYRHLLHLPLRYFLDRDVGDIIARFGSLEPVLRLFTHGIIATIVDGTLAVITVFLLLAYNAQLAIVVISILLLQLSIQLVTLPRLRRHTADSIQANASEQTVFIESMRSIVSLKANAMERARHMFWQNRLCDAIGADNQLAAFGIRIGTLVQLLSALENVLVIYLGALAVIGAEMTIGMLYAFIAYKNHFTGSVGKLIEQVVAFRMLRLHLERLGDIALTETEPGASVPGQDSLSGTLCLRDLGFAYGSDRPPMVQGLNLEVPKGTHIAITGPSATGKTTILKLILGLLTPTQGEVLFDEIPASRLGSEQIRKWIGVVMQGDTLFTGSVTENVALFALDVDEERVAESCALAGIAADIERLPMKYETHIGDMGVVMSAGQVQRILIARALYKRPRILILDEATVHLDDETRARVNESLRCLHVTVIRVTHQMDELTSCAQVYQLRDARLERVQPPLIPPNAGEGGSPGPDSARTGGTSSL